MGGGSVAVVGSVNRRTYVSLGLDATGARRLKDGSEKHEPTVRRRRPSGAI